MVTEDFDVPSAAQMVAAATFVHSGQMCMGTKRVYVHESVYDEFMKHLTKIVENFSVGEGFLSPIQNKMQYEKVKGIYEDCEQHQYNFAVGGVTEFSKKSYPSYYISPAVIANPPENSRIVQEEPLGPIIPVLKYRDDDDVVERLNDTIAGLRAIIYCRDEERAWSPAGRVEAASI